MEETGQGRIRCHGPLGGIIEICRSRVGLVRPLEKGRTWGALCWSREEEEEDEEEEGGDEAEEERGSMRRMRRRIGWQMTGPRVQRL